MTWIPVSERLPDADEEVIITHLHHGGRLVCAGAIMTQWDPDDAREWRSGDWTIGDVLAWQPLPAPWVGP